MYQPSERSWLDKTLHHCFATKLILGISTASMRGQFTTVRQILNQEDSKRFMSCYAIKNCGCGRFAVDFMCRAVDRLYI